MLDLYLKIILYHVLNVVKIFELLSKVKEQLVRVQEEPQGWSTPSPHSM